MNAVNSLTASIPNNSKHSSSSLLSKFSMIAEQYQELLHADFVKKNGAVYTPTVLAQKMVSRALELCNHSPRSIIDLSCGSGIFLIEALSALIEQNPKAKADALTRIYATELDPDALAFCKILLRASAGVLGIPFADAQRITTLHYQCADALIREASQLQQTDLYNQASHHSSFSQLFPEVFKNNHGFDLILGNPPYGLSRDQRLSSEYTSLLKKLYRGKIRGRINTYLLFIIKAFELLNSEGVLSLVVPNAWLGIDEAQPVREMLLQQGSLCELNTFNSSPFGALGVEVVTFVAKKNAGNQKIIVRNFSDIKADTPLSLSLLELKDIQKDSNQRISIKSSATDSGVIRLISSKSSPLIDAHFKASIALQVYGTGRGIPKQTKEIVQTHPFHVKSALNQDCIPYLEGDSVKPYSISWGGTYLHYGPWMAEHHPIERYKSPRILIREILGSKQGLISAAFTDQPFTYNRSVLHIHGTQQSTASHLKALTLILNSSLASYWIFHRGRKSQRTKFPKLVAADLNDFPISQNFEQNVELLEELYKCLISNDKGNESLNQEALAEVDQQIFKLYSIPTKSQGLIISLLKTL